MDEKYQSSRHFHGSTTYSTKMDRRYVISGDAAAKKFNERTVNMDKRYTPEEEIPAQLFVHIKTSNDNIYATNADELITELKKHKDDKVIKFEHYDSIISMIKDDYMHSDVCMAELIRSTWLDKVDFEDIAVLLHWAGEEDCLFSFTSMEE